MGYVGLPGEAATLVLVGPVGTTAFVAEDRGPSPLAFTAEISNVYDTPLVRPVTVVLVAGGAPETVAQALAPPLQ